MTRIPFGPTFIDLEDKDSAVSFLCGRIEKKQLTHVVTLNALMFNELLTDQELRNNINNAGLIIADSIGISFSSRFLFSRKISRIPGIDLIYHLCEASEKAGYSIFLLGSKDDTCVKAAANLKSKYPNLKIAGCHHGYFLGESEKNVKDLIKASKPDILLTGLASPLQEKWIAANLSELGVPVVIGVGGSFDVISGSLKRAPQFMQFLGLEWLFRLIQQPWRITRMKQLPGFVFNIILIKFNLFTFESAPFKAKFTPSRPIQNKSEENSGVIKR